jgi:polysaccharide chain length determinant protein (PEP-CTERM system associated)
LKTIGAEVADRRTGKPPAAAVAFTLSFEGRNPEQVLQVANVVTSLYLEENLQVRERKAQETTTFLEDEMNQVKGQLTAVEGEIAAFKEGHINELPETLQVNLQSLDRIDRDVERLIDQVRAMKEREGYLRTQLAAVPPEERGDRKRLNELRLQLVSLQNRFSDEYPDVIKTRAEIAELEKRLAGSGDAAASNPGEAVGAGADQPDNPVYITLSSQLAGTQVEIESLKRQLEALTKQRQEYRRRIEANPRVEESYKSLVLERDNLQAKYSDLMRKLMEAKVAHGLEKEQKGERFTLVDPARLPESPHKPNRLAILVVGLVLGTGAGVGAAAFREHTDQSVRSAEALTLAFSVPVLASIPEIVTAGDMRRRQARRTALAVGILVFLVVGLAVFHFLVMDLDVFWARAMRRLAL